MVVSFKKRADTLMASVFIHELVIHDPRHQRIVLFLDKEGIIVAIVASIFRLFDFRTACL